MIRFRDGVSGNHGALSVKELREKLAGEIADIVIYCDLWAASEDIDLAEAVVATFNAKSDKIGSPYKLAP
jgi:NTP pyrophosphatase (non-canonical NTP hydrolase)